MKSPLNAAQRNYFAIISQQVRNLFPFHKCFISMGLTWQ